ncbi:hypothetical protein FVEG_13581 [Fusarium verticillioides 7600]|uniref:Apple domain-containing protein n=1 Tax=Gibberella moniliformis (strain M3125 / FGSC 7600) TaxID=334819 RepID=W7N7A0_GIBM7|nr:hypothetical protein FVEG_13581 [Fusarium verticillioides 7600]EWG55599.1 hypothetical protein FVEG_13581 [Fusarium verticillioides 7600]
MQSKIVLVSLALAGFAACGPCKPSSRVTASSPPTTSSVATIDVSKSSTDSQTNINSLTITLSAGTTEVPSSTLPQSSTTTQEEDIIITNAISGGSFASRDPNSPSGLTNFGASGNAEFHQGGCYRVDGSLDDGCAALSANGDVTKRSFFGSFASIFQTVRSVPRKKYTIQFFYLIRSAGGQGCIASAAFGNAEFYSQPASSSGPSWARVLRQVEAFSDLPTFAISLTCSGGGTSSILVDSIFISDQITPETIGNFHLDLGGSPPINPVETTTAIRAQESPTLTSQSESTGIGGLESTSAATSISTTSLEVASSATTEAQSTSSDSEIASAASESSESLTSSTEPPSGGTTDTTAISVSSTSPAAGETSVAETTSSTSVEIGLTSQSVTTAEPSHTTSSACKQTCEIISDYYAHLDDFGCDLNGVFTNSGAIYTLPGEEVGAPQTHSYSTNAECAEICKTLPGCLSAGFQTLSGKCFFSNTLVTRDEIRDGRDSQMVHWFGMECFTCGCSTGGTSTSAIPTTTVVSEPTSFTTTTKATQPTGVCHNNRGQECEINPSSVENNPYVCIGGGVFLGEAWTVPRSLYPMQENGEQCAAICDTLENYSDFAEPDPNYDDFGLDPKNSVWSHRSCYTCPTCVLSNAPLPKSPTCNYKPGDSCTRVSADSVLCNYLGMLPGTFGALGSYPDQSSSGKCAAICRKMKDCMGSGYRDGQCMFTSTTLAPGDFLDRHNYDLVWDDPSCFECPGCST